ncbi:hypothetical protein DXG01_004030 [Tephrocybe rancida]|nr:hypothetical protein DXG01_004030 [Tephrocybe rancida]
MKLYRKLWEVGSAEDFMEIYVDCVECHFHAYSKGRVLHRDLSENNLMFKTVTDGTKKGILNDWDMASFVDENDEIQLSTATHRTGTVPFMAKDLLVATPPPHLFRHDLESFFYILVWAAVHHDFSAKTRRPTVPAVVRWASEDFETVLESKSYFFTEISKFNLVLANVLPDSAGLVPWIRLLWKMFSKAFQMAETIARDTDDSQRGGEASEWDHATLGGQITFFTFMKALGRTPRSNFSP